MTINSRKLPDIVWAEKHSGGHLVLPLEAWQGMRLRPTGEKLALSHGKTGYALDAVQGLQYQLNIGKLALIITAPAEAFEAIVLDHGRGGTAPPNQSPPG